MELQCAQVIHDATSPQLDSDSKGALHNTTYKKMLTTEAQEGNVQE